MIISENGTVLGTQWEDTRERSLRGWEGVQLATWLHQGGPELDLTELINKLGSPDPNTEEVKQVLA